MNSPIGLDVTGFDTEALIQELMKVERRPVVALELKQKQIADKKAAWDSVKTKLESIMSKMKSLLDKTTYSAKTTTITDTKVVSAEASADSAQGTYNIEVIQLAKAHSIQSGIFAKPAGDPLGFSGNLTFSVGEAAHGGGEVVIEVSAGDSLFDIAKQINDEEDLGLEASVIQVAPDEYTLVLTASSTNQEISVEMDLDNGGLDSLAFETVAGQEPQGAVFKINGVEVRRDSNQISDVIDGLSLDLHQTGSTTITVDYDDDAIVSAVKGFIAEYNSLLDSAAKYNSWDGETKRAGILFGDPLLQRLLSSAQQVIFRSFADKAPGFNYAGAVGISTGPIGSFSRDGKLTLDESKLREALSVDREAVASLFGDKNKGSEGMMESLRQAFQAYVAYDGLLPLRNELLNDQHKDISNQIENLERRLQIRLAGLRKQFTALESLMMQMSSQGAWLAQQVQGLF